jgi:hypothetical protein
MYEDYKVNADNLEEGFLKSKLLVLVSRCDDFGGGDVLSLIAALQAFKAIFTSPSSAKEVDGDGDGADILENNRRARRKSEQGKVKTCVASIINMRKVTPRAIAYIVCQVSKCKCLMCLISNFRVQVRFALSGISSWRTVDGDFDYEAFWTNIVAFFEVVPGPVTRRRVDKLLEWWTR